MNDQADTLPDADDVCVSGDDGTYHRRTRIEHVDRTQRIERGRRPRRTGRMMHPPALGDLVKRQQNVIHSTELNNDKNSNGWNHDIFCF